MSNIANAVRPSPTGPAAPAATENNPFVTSSVNGMVIPLLPHQGGILHRFKRPGNPIVVDRIEGAAAPDDRDGRRLVMESPISGSTPEEQAADAASKAEMDALLTENPLM